MNAITPNMEDLVFNLSQEIHIEASFDITWETLLEQIGPDNQAPDGRPLPMNREPWVGDRWYRDLGEGNGHLWGHLQAIIRPTLLELPDPCLCPTQSPRMCNTGSANKMAEHW